MKQKWKVAGLGIALAMQVLFLVSYFSLLLVKIGSPLADALWLLSGAMGFLFGVINLIANLKEEKRGCGLIFSIAALALGVFLPCLWVLAVFVSGM